jgi:hypothetical protein
MHYLIILALLLSVVYGPQLWLQYTIKRYSQHREDLAGSGGELAQHLVKRFMLEGVSVEQTEKGDHYDPQTRVVALSKATFEDHSIAAVAVAAHEVGHAIQHSLNERGLRWRTRLAILAHYAGKIGASMMMVIPLFALVTKVPAIALISFASGFTIMASSTVVHLLTFPVEWDASFNKAYPILVEGQYIQPQDQPAVRSLLMAAALTYVAASLISLLSFWRWMRMIRS